MGIPAEARRVLRHLINISTPYSYDSPDFALCCPGVEELTENFEADTEDIQYICAQTKTRNIKGFTVGFDLSLKYIQDSRMQKWANRIFRNPPTGLAASCDYIRFNLCEPMFGEDNRYIGVRRKAAVEPSSIGGAATDSMTSALHISGISDPEIGYVTVENPGTENVKFTWTKAELPQPVILIPKDGFVAKEDDKTDNKVEISGTGQPKAAVTVSYTTDKNSTAKSLTDTTVEDDGTWKTSLPLDNIKESVKIKAAATLKDDKGNSSISSDTVEFKVLKKPDPPKITYPKDKDKDISVSPTITGTGISGAKVTVTITPDGGDTSKTFSSNVLASGAWNVDISQKDALEAGKSYKLKANQALNDVKSDDSTEITFTTKAADKTPSSPTAPEDPAKNPSDTPKS